MTKKHRQKTWHKSNTGEYRPTTDDWYPCYADNLVHVRTVVLSDGKFRVCVWGADDFGMEIDVSTRDQMLSIYRSLPVIITIKDLYERGFHRA